MSAGSHGIDASAGDGNATWLNLGQDAYTERAKALTQLNTLRPRVEGGDTHAQRVAGLCI